MAGGGGDLERQCLLLLLLVKWQEILEEKLRFGRQRLLPPGLVRLVHLAHTEGGTAGQYLELPAEAATDDRRSACIMTMASVVSQ